MILNVFEVACGCLIGVQNGAMTTRVARAVVVTLTPCLDVAVLVLALDSSMPRLVIRQIHLGGRRSVT